MPTGSGRICRRWRAWPPGSRPTDDVVQEALARAWRKWPQFDAERGTSSAWLLAIVADQARQARRKRPIARLSADVPGRVRSTNDRLDVEFAVARLPPRQRLAVDCFYFVGLSVVDAVIPAE